MAEARLEIPNPITNQEIIPAIDQAELAQRAAKGIAAALAVAAEGHDGPLSLGLAGGRAALATIKLLGAELVEKGVDPSRIVAFAADERHGEQLNWPEIGVLLREAGVTNHIVPPAATEAGTVGVAAQQYATALQTNLPKDSNGKPRIDVLVLSIGEDGHVASEFPTDSTEDGTGIATVSVTNGYTTWVQHSPKAPSERVSLSYDLMNTSRHTFLLVSGSGKQAAYQKARAQHERTPHFPVAHPLPAARIMNETNGFLTILVDRDAEPRNFRGLGAELAAVGLGQVFPDTMYVEVQESAQPNKVTKLQTIIDSLRQHMTNLIVKQGERWDEYLTKAPEEIRETEQEIEGE